MDSEPNPYATPAVAQLKTDSNNFPNLPLVYRPGFLDYFFLVPVGLTVGAVFAGSFASVIARILQFKLAVSDLLIAAIAVLAGIAFTGFFSAALSFVKIDSSSVKISGLRPEHILFKDIQSWHFEPVTRCVVISFYEIRNDITLNSTVMTRDRSEVLGKVLRKFVGPPGQVQ